MSSTYDDIFVKTRMICLVCEYREIVKILVTGN